MEVDLDADCTIVSAELKVRRNPAAGVSGEYFWLDGVDVTLEHAAIEGRAIDACSFVRDGDRWGTPVPPVAEFTFSYRVRIFPRRNSSRQGLYVSNGSLCTHCEPEGFRRIGLFPDRPDVMSRFRVVLRADREEYPLLVSNGDLISTRELPDGRHEAVWQDPYPKACYLFAIVAGRYSVLEDSFITKSGREVAIRLLASPAYLERLREAASWIKQAMRWDEQAYDREYDLSTFHLVVAEDFQGAMENKGVNIFAPGIPLFAPDSETDWNFLVGQMVVGHEYFHNWTGARVGCRDWFNLCLKEGLTVFRQWDFSEAMGSKAYKRLWFARLFRAEQFFEDAGPGAHATRPESYVDVSNFYTATVYKKGAEIVRMMRTLVGERAFAEGIASFFAEFDGRPAQVDDLVTLVEKASGRDLVQFRLWFSSVGSTKLRVSRRWLEGDRCLELRLEQSTVDFHGKSQPALHIPVAVRFISENGDPISTACVDGKTGVDHLIEMRDGKQTVLVSGVGERTIPELLRGFSAPVQVEHDLSSSELASLSARAEDSYVRWSAMQELFAAEIGRAERLRNRYTSLDVDLAAGIRHILADSSIDDLVRSELLAMPDFRAIVEGRSRYDPIAVCGAIERVRKSIAAAFSGEWLEWLQVPDIEGQNIQAMGQRSLRRLAMEYAAATDAPAVACRALALVEKHTCMTEVESGLIALSHIGGSTWRRASVAYCRHWGEDHAAMDRWLSIQARSRAPGALARVKQLVATHFASESNLSRLKAFLRAFATGNPRGVHGSGERGYDFLIQQLKLLDAGSPYLAAWSGLLDEMLLYARYPLRRREAIRARLRSLWEDQSISGALRERLEGAVDAHASH